MLPYWLEGLVLMFYLATLKRPNSMESLYFITQQQLSIDKAGMSSTLEKLIYMKLMSFGLCKDKVLRPLK